MFFSPKKVACQILEVWNDYFKESFVCIENKNLDFTIYKIIIGIVYPKKLKRMTFHNSFEEQRVFGQQPSIEMTPEQRIKKMYRLNKKINGENYGKLSKEIEIFKALPGESVNDFYNRINSNV